MERQDKTSAPRSLAYYATADFLGKAVGIFVSPLATRLLTPHQYGVPALLAGVWTIITLIQYGGMDSSYPFFRAHARSREEESRVLSTANAIALGSLAATVLLFTLTAFLWGGIMKYVQFASHREMLAGIVCTGVAAALYWLLYVLRYQQQARAFALATVVGNILAAVCFVAMAWFFPQGSRLEARFWIYALFAAAASLMAWGFIARRQGSPVNRRALNGSLARQMLAYGAFLVPGGMIYAGFTVADRLLLGWLRDTSEVAVFAIASALAGVVLMMKNWFSLVWSPLVSEWIAERDPADYAPKLDRMFGLICLFFFPLTVMAAAWARPALLLLYPPFYEKAAGPIILLLLAGAFSLLSLVANVSTIIAKTPRFHTPVYAAALVINLALGLWLIPPFGAVGAVAGTAAGELAILILWLAVTNRVLKKNHLSWVPRLPLVAACSFFCLLFLPGLPLGEASLAARAGMTGALVAGYLFILGRKRAEVAFVWRFLRGALPWLAEK